MWLNDKLILIAVCCLSYDVFVFGLKIVKRDVSSVLDDVGKKLVKNHHKGSSSDRESTGEGDDDDFASSLGDWTNWNKDTDDDDDDLTSSFESDNDSKNGSNKTNKGTGSGYDSSSGLDSENGSKKKKQPKETDKKKNKPGSSSSTSGSKNNTTSNTDWSTDLGTDYDSNWPNDQGWSQTSIPNTTASHFPGTNSTSGKNTTSTESPHGKNTTSPINITDWLNGLIDEAEKNSSQNNPPSHSTSNFTSADNVTTKIPHQNLTSTEKPPSSTTSTPESKYSTGYWIPIFNFGNDFYFLTNKGYAKLVNFPAPVIYSFMPVSLKIPDFKPTGGQLRQEEEEFIGNFFKNEASFAECYVNSNMGNLIPYSYFGSWVAVFNLQNGWHLQTYGGFVPLDMTSEQAPVTFEFDPIKYQYPTMASVVSTTVTVEETSHGKGEGLATWSEPVVVED